MATFLISLIACVAAGAFTARTIVRRELERARLPVPQPLPAPAPPPPPPEPAVTPAPAPPEELSPEILMVLSAAVAAFLGKRARIRSARLRTGQDPSSAWAQQGRVFVQASHNLPHGGRF